MPEFTRPATWEDVKLVARYFNEAGVVYAIIGGYALSAHGISRVTIDVDVLVEPSSANSRRWILALSRLPDGAVRELAADPDVFASEKRYAIRVNDEFTVDILPSASGHGWDELKPHVTQVCIDDVIINVLDLEGLLKTKQGVRPKDQLDAELIRRAIEVLKRP